MNMRRTPGIVMIAPGIGAGLDRGEAIAAILIGKGFRNKRKIRTTYSLFVVLFLYFFYNYD
jgi:hypothetical protein